MSESEDSVSGSIGIGQVSGLITRHRWWILTAACIVPLVVIAVLLRLPDRYTSEATLVVVQQQVSSKYVDPANTTSSADLIKGMTRETLSGPKLLAVVDAFGLYAKERSSMRQDVLVERMRKDIEVRPLDQLSPRSDYTAFSVSFTADTPRLAQDVTSRLASLFIEENLKVQGTQASTTTKFIAEQLDAAKQRLAQQEEKLRQFKVGNLGSLPEQEQANLSILTDLRMQLQNALSTRSRTEQARVNIESSLNGVLARLRLERTSLLAQYTPKHPEVQKKDQEIEGASALLASLKAGTTPAERPQGSSAAEEPTVAQLRGQLAALLAENGNFSREESRLRAQIAQYQARLRLTPIKQQQLSEILRDYELYKSDYADLQNKQLRSQLTANLAENQGSQQFRLVDPPTLPSVPSSPKRLKISLGAFGGGIALGAVLAFLMEMRTRTFHTEKELKDRFKAPLIVGVPLLRTPKEERGRRLRIGLEYLAGCTMMLMVLVAEWYVYLHSYEK